MTTRYRTIAAFALTALALLATESLAGSFTVLGTDTGGFGEPNFFSSGGTPLATGPTFAAAGEGVLITATATVFLADFGTFPVGAAGRSDLPRGAAGAHTPLEEALIDAGTPPSSLNDASAPLLHLGALIGAFVPAATVAAPGFQAVDEDLVPTGIDSTSLFLIGSGPFEFVAPAAGTLFFGVNDMNSPNNSGSFTVTTEPVPEPGSGALIALPLAALALRRRRTRRS